MLMMMMDDRVASPDADDEGRSSANGLSTKLLKGAARL
jgi:hypothetical protein